MPNQLPNKQSAVSGGPKLCHEECDCHLDVLKEAEEERRRDQEMRDAAALNGMRSRGLYPEG